jgi:phage-related protein
MSAPVEHVQEAMKMTSGAETHLWEIILRDGTRVFLRNGPSVTWQGHLYENLPILLSGEEISSEDKTNRPGLKVFNPMKIFGPWAHEGKFELAIVIRKTLLVEHLNSNANIAVRKIWKISQIQTCTSRLLDVQLSSPTDGPNITVPYRFYGPPEFPTVSF